MWWRHEWPLFCSSYCSICWCSLFQLMSLVFFFVVPKNIRKTYGFLKFSAGIERDQWHEMGDKSRVKLFLSRFSIILHQMLYNNWAYWNNGSIGTNWVNPLSANPTKWSNTLKQFVGRSRRILWVCFDYFVGLALKGLTHSVLEYVLSFLWINYRTEE